MRVELTLGRFPSSPELQEKCAAPFGFTLEPFAYNDSVPLTKQPKPALADIPRCSECGAYINCYSGLDSIGWRCSICGAYSEYVQKQIRKYSKPAIRETQPELQKHIFEALCPSYDSQSVREGYQVMSGPFPAPRDGHHVVIFVVDVSTTEDFLDHIKLAMSAALEVLPPHTLVGLISAADHIGLWDVQGTSPAVRNVPVFEAGAIMCPLEDAMPLRALIAPLDTFAAQISTAVDQLQPAPIRGRLALGSIVNAVLDYLHVLVDEIPPGTPSASQNSTADSIPPLGPTKLVLLLNSPPTTGSGAVADPPATGLSPTHIHPPMPHLSSPPAPQQSRYNPPYSQQGTTSTNGGTSLAVKIPEASRSFYENLATLAAALGVCVDTFAVGPTPVGLGAHAPLCEFTGGVCFHYASLEASAVPQDLCRRLQTPQALSALLRVRCCPELRVARAYGRLVADTEHDHLYHCVACDPYDAMAFDLALTSKHGFQPHSNGKSTHPVVQIAFQYSMLIYKKQRPTDEGTPPSRVYELQRRLRVLTIAPAVAKTEKQLYDSFFTEPSLALLMHKALRLSQLQSVSDSRQLLQEWLVMFLANWHQNNNRDKDNGTPHHPSTSSHIDATLVAAPRSLQALVPATYALLRSAPLSPLVGASHSDRTQALCSLWTSLAPPELMRSIYPLFVTTENLHEVDFNRCTLECATIANHPDAIFLLDAYHQVVVMYGRGCTAEFPPPQDSHLRATVNSMRQKRRIVPEVTFCREGDAKALALQDHLINEPLPAAALDDTTATEACTLGYSDWIGYLQHQAQALLMQGAR